MTLALKLEGNEFSEQEVQEVVASALASEVAQAEARRAYFAKLCTQFEEKYGFSSDEFMRRFEAGELGDEEELFDWYAAKRGFDLWDRRYRILSQVTV